MIITYGKGDTPLHHLNPLAKLAAVFAACTAIFLFWGLAFTLSYFVAVLLVAQLTGNSRVAEVMRTRFAVLLSVWMVFGYALFTTEGKPVLTIPLYFFHLTITGWGLLLGVIVTVRFLAIFMVSALFIATTEPAALVYSLMRRGLPYRYGFLLVLMLRFVPLFERERKSVSDAQKIRGLELDKRGVKSLYRSLRYTLVPMIVSALSKVDNLTMSMEGRAFGYKSVRTFTFEDRYRRRDKALIAISFLAVLIMLIGRFMGWRFLLGPNM